MIEETLPIEAHRWRKELVELAGKSMDDAGGMPGNHTGPTLCPCGKEHANGSLEAMVLDDLYQKERFVNTLLWFAKMGDHDFERLYYRLTNIDEDEVDWSKPLGDKLHPPYDYDIHNKEE